MLYCKNCGQKVSESDRFCEKCSARLDRPDSVITTRQYAAEKKAGEFDPDTVSAAVDLTAYEVFGYRIMDRQYAEFDRTVYSATRLSGGDSESTWVRHTMFPAPALQSRLLLDFAMHGQRADFLCTEIAAELLEEINRFMACCAELALPCVYEEAACFYNEAERVHHMFVRMKPALPLSQYARSHSMNVRKCLELASAAMRQLAVLHKHEVPYAALTDDNLFVDEDGQLYLGARESEVLRACLPGLCPATAYRELFQPADRAAGEERAADIYAVGILLYRLLNGYRHPFVNVFARGTGYAELAQAEEARRRMQTPQLPYFAQNSLGAAVVKACAPCAGRYRSVEELGRIVENALTFLSADELNRTAIDPQKLAAGQFPYDGRRQPAYAAQAAEPMQPPAQLQPQPGQAVGSGETVRVSRQAEQNTAENTDNKRRGVVLLSLALLILATLLGGVFLLQRAYGASPAPGGPAAGDIVLGTLPGGHISGIIGGFDVCR